MRSCHARLPMVDRGDSKRMRNLKSLATSCDPTLMICRCLTDCFANLVVHGELDFD